MNIDTKTVIELKALAYDTLSRITQEQQNLDTINKQLDKKIKEEEAAKQEKEKVEPEVAESVAA